jgi:hypothetical protein
VRASLVKALLRLYLGSFKAPLRLFQGCIKDLLELVLVERGHFDDSVAFYPLELPRGL